MFPLDFVMYQDMELVFNQENQALYAGETSNNQEHLGYQGMELVFNQEHQGRSTMQEETPNKARAKKLEISHRKRVEQ